MDDRNNLDEPAEKKPEPGQVNEIRQNGCGVGCLIFILITIFLAFQLGLKPLRVACYMIIYSCIRLFFHDAVSSTFTIILFIAIFHVIRKLK